MALYNLRRVRVTKVAVVERGANGLVWHLKKSGEPEDRTEIVAPILKAQNPAWKVANAAMTDPANGPHRPLDAGRSSPRGALPRLVYDVLVSQRSRRITCPPAAQSLTSLIRAASTSRGQSGDRR